MNEELKIIIKAVTDDAKKGIQGVNKELSGMKSNAAKGGKALAAIGKVAAVAVAAVAAVGAAVVAMGAALSKVSENTAEYRKSMAQLNTAFQANGASAAQAQKTYGELFRFMGETDTAVEASNLLSQLTNDEKELAQWTKTLQGVYATFPDSLPIEALVESSNETARVGKVTGNLADALNWAGVSEDEFNTKLAQTNTLTERETLIRETLSGLYNDAAELYEKNAASILAQNEAQNRLNNTLARVGAAAQPLQTALTNLSATLLNALAPAIEAIIPYLVSFMNIISKAVSWVFSLINALTGSNKAVKATENLAASVKNVGSTANNAAKGAGAITDGLEDASKAAEKLKRSTQSFDELNIMANPASSSTDSGSASSTPAYTGAIGGGAIGSGDIGLTDAFDTTSKSADNFAKKIKDVFSKIKQSVKEYATLFTPTFNAWKQSFSDIKQPIAESFESIKGSFSSLITDTYAPFYEYIATDFIPSLTNNFSENFAPIFSDVMSFSVKQFATDFEWMCEQVNIGVNDIIYPAFETLKEITMDTTKAVGDEWKKSGDTLLERFGGFVESIKGIWENLYNNILKPVWDIILEALNKIWDESLEPLYRKLLSFFSKLIECVLTLWNNVLAPLVNWIIQFLAPRITNIVQFIMDVVRTVVGVISGVVGGVLDALGGLLDFITGVFSGNWKKAWNGLKDFFKGIWDSIWAICKGVVNLIIDGINALWRGIYNAISGLINGIGSIAGAIGDLFGKDWSFKMPKKAPTIPKLATGGIVTKETLATIGERGKEAVLPLENNTGWMDMLAEKIAARNSAPAKLVLNVDGRELGYATIGAINNITKQTGTLQLAII